jgi:hypothetical protein
MNNVREEEQIRWRDGDMEHADVGHDEVATFGEQPELEIPDGFVAERELGDRAVVGAITVPVTVAPLKGGSARHAESLIGSESQEALGARIPRDDPIAAVGDENRVR